MNDFLRETPLGSESVDSDQNSEEEPKPSSGTPAEVFSARARKIKRSYSAMPAVALPSEPEEPGISIEEDDAGLPAPLDQPRVASIRRRSSTAIKTVADLELRFMPIRKAVDDILKPLSIAACADNGLRFYKVYIELCASNKDFAELLAEWLNDRIVKIRKPGDEKPEDYVIVNCTKNDLDGMFPVVLLVRNSDRNTCDVKADKIPLLNVLPDLQY